MPVTDVQQDLDNLTLTITADFAAPVERIWQVYADPRQLEKVWGPPTYPATVVDHDLTPGGRMTYFMTGPDGDKHAGLAADLPASADSMHRAGPASRPFVLATLRALRLDPGPYPVLSTRRPKASKTTGQQPC